MMSRSNNFQEIGSSWCTIFSAELLQNFDFEKEIIAIYYVKVESFHENLKACMLKVSTMKEKTFKVSKTTKKKKFCPTMTRQ